MVFRLKFFFFFSFSVSGFDCLGFWALRVFLVCGDFFGFRVFRVYSFLGALGYRVLRIFGLGFF